MDPLSTLKTVLNDAVSTSGLGDMSTYGVWLIGALFVIHVSWTGIKNLLEGEGANGALASIINAVFIAGMATAIIGGATIGGGAADGSKSLGQQLITGFDVLASKIAHVDTSKPGDLAEQVLGKAMITSAKMFVGKTDDAQATAPSGQEESAFSGIAKAASELWDKVSFGTILASLVNLIFKFFMAMMLLLAALVFVAQFIFTQIMINIGLLLMPVMVPWVLLDSSKFIFDGWLHFMIKAGMTKVVGAIIYAISIKAVNSAMDLSEQGFQANEPLVMFMAYAASFLLVGLMAFLMLQATGIAEGLISGRGGATWKPVGKLDPGRGAAAAPGSIGSAAKTTGGAVAGGVSGSVKGGIQGADNGAVASRGKSSAVAMGVAAARGVAGAVSGGVRGAINGVKGSGSAPRPGGTTGGGSPGTGSTSGGVAALRSTGGSKA